MKYMGSKNRHAKHLLPIILKNREEGEWYVEPFVGGANMIDKVEGKRIGSDNNKYLIDFWKATQNGFLPPVNITSKQYFHIKENKEEDTVLTLWAGICCSYGGKWFGGYINDYKESRRGKNGVLPNHQRESRNSIIKQIPKLTGVTFLNCSYEDLNLKKKCLIYCDPPYHGTTKYKDEFDHLKFWKWCREMVMFGHKVFISEYNAPEDFICIKQILTNTQLGNGCNTGNQIKIEKLFIHKSQLCLLK